MVSGTAPTTSRANVVVVVVVDFLLNSGLYNLMINCNVIFSLVGIIHQEEGIVGMIEIAKVKVGIINDQIITWLWNFDGTVATYNGGFRVCKGIRVDIVAYKNARKAMLSSSELCHVLITARTSWRLSAS